MISGHQTWRTAASIQIDTDELQTVAGGGRVWIWWKVTGTRLRLQTDSRATSATRGREKATAWNPRPEGTSAAGPGPCPATRCTTKARRRLVRKHSSGGTNNDFLKRELWSIWNSTVAQVTRHSYWFDSGFNHVQMSRPQTTDLTRQLRDEGWL